MGSRELVGAATKWEPLVDDCEALIARAEEAGFDVGEALSFEGPEGPTARAWTASPFADMHPKPRLHPKPGMR